MIDLYYDELGKHTKMINTFPSHSHNFSAIIVSDETVGIDIELQRDKIIRIADKFVDEEQDLDKNDLKPTSKKTNCDLGSQRPF
jgi:hypothetical protein